MAAFPRCRQPWGSKAPCQLRPPRGAALQRDAVAGRGSATAGSTPGAARAAQRGEPAVVLVRVGVSVGEQAQVLAPRLLLAAAQRLQHPLCLGGLPGRGRRRQGQAREGGA